MYYDQDIGSVFESLGSSINGLTGKEAEVRLAGYGHNEIIDEKKTSRLRLLTSQFKSFLILILIAASIVSAILGEFADSILIVFIVILSGVLGFIQEYRAETEIEALRKMASPNAKVIREGKVIILPSRCLVPGDMIILQTGDRIPADSRLVDAINLNINESSLTGESVPVEKNIEQIHEDVTIGDRKNMVYMGTTVSSGRGKAIVTGTGMETELGKVAAMLGQIERRRTPLQESLDQMGKWIGIITLIVVFVVSVIGIIGGFELIDMFIWGVALAVAAVPEALPVVVTVGLALGVRRMVKRNALIRKLPSVETLGATTVICSDKTGTLTQDEMTVTKIYSSGRILDVTGVGYVPEGEIRTGHPEKLLKIAVLCNDSELVKEKDKWSISGDPTEGALLVAAAKGGIRKQEVEAIYRRVDEIPFSSERKRMTTIHLTQDGKYVYSKGAPELILNSCDRIYYDGRGIDLTGDEKEKILNVIRSMASDALRVMAFSYKQIPPDHVSLDRVEDEMVFVGLTGMIDPPREEVKKAIGTCNLAGIKTIMITGDHPLTAMAVARDLNLFRHGDIVLTGAELDKKSAEELEQIVENIAVYARVSPAHKMRIIDAFKKKGHVVAMTGDGVNDAPALKAADMGISMGITGTDVSKEASDMILTDDNFASIVSAVEEGRNIFKNIRNFVLYGLTCHMGEVLAVLIGMLYWQALPLIAVQILWINLITDGLPPMALSVEPPDKGIMNQPPRPKYEGILTRRVLIFSMIVGLIIALQAVLVFSVSLPESDQAKAQTMVFTTIVFSEMFNAFNWRSDRYSVFRIGFFSNPGLLYAVAVTILLQLVVIYVPFLNGPFNTVPLELTDWGMILPLASTTLIFVEVWKFIEKKNLIPKSR